MAFSLKRFFRGMRSACAPIMAIICFSLMLTYIFILYQPTPGPGIKQRLGWQSWDIVSMSESDLASAANTTAPTSGTDEDIPDGVDWWNVTQGDATYDSASLPLDVWGPLLPHDTGLSEITLTRCMIDPKFAEDLCSPDTTPEKDAIRGNWVRVERNLNVEAGYWSGISGEASLYYRRTRRQDINLITDIRLLPKDEEPSSEDGWHKVSLSARAGVIGVPPMYLWYRVGKTAGAMTAEERGQIITELDVLYGEDIPWSRPRYPLTGRTVDTWLTFRRGVKPPPRAPPLHFSHSGDFKILQVADLHFSVSQGKCRDVDFPCQNSDNLTSTMLGRSVLAKFARAVTERGIPWAAIFGNHDSEVGAGREEQMKLMKALPYSLVQRGPEDIHGVGNYVLKVMSADASKMHLLTLYFLDSGSYSNGFLQLLGSDQIDWFLQESGSISPIERPFSPDTGKDFGDSWTKRQEDQVTPITTKLAKPNALMFFHIPLPESYTPADTDPRTGQPLDVGIHGEETAGNAKGTDGFFEKALLASLESEHVSKGTEHEVKVVANGHCHLTENCRRVHGIWLCFGGGGSYSGYGKIGFDRRFRVYQISDYGETIRTYKRTEKDEILDEMVLVGRGAAP
ncbi:Metallo-dependent phosphatase-like protein [Desarmillaria tabescens]|uniref:Metallo-dependent phosphatase-like protein n=1 Tax=Armillaria tabescens TaxID=1929756 RepID=A0AA39KDD3_ARMTA|nr:Metallo-dependent phosphatase-like protein [Desarmillaria tabescens]KAK0457796.1 Metallo-dependent phosphatase-like protein [Desarmillaria tabescens]